MIATSEVEKHPLVCRSEDSELVSVDKTRFRRIIHKMQHNVRVSIKRITETTHLIMCVYVRMCTDSFHSIWNKRRVIQTNASISFCFVFYSIWTGQLNCCHCWSVRLRDDNDDFLLPISSFDIRSFPAAALLYKNNISTSLILRYKFINVAVTN